MLEKRLLKRVDWLLVGAALILQLFGLLAIATATGASPGAAGSFGHVQRQAMAMLVGWIALYVAASFAYTELRRFSQHIFILNVALMAATLWAGSDGQGAQRWLELGPVTFQPSELGKVFVIITLAYHVSLYEGKLSSWFQLVLTGIHVSIPLILIGLQPDLGTAMVLGAIWLGVVLVGGQPPGRLALLVLLGVAVVAGALFLHLEYEVPLPLQDYQINRLVVFINPDLDPTGAGYHLRQSIIAVGSGRVVGQGLFSGQLKELQYLPEQHTDFIFAVVGEEMGFRGTAILLGLFMVFIWRALLVIMSARDLFGALLAAGIVSMFAFHIVVNVGMTVGLMPITGLPLPFISYGGSSLIANCIAVGLLVNIGMRRHKIMF